MEESSKNLDELLNSQMSARDKTGLGYGTQLNEMSNNSKTDSEISLSVFYVRSSDEESTPANDRSSKADGYHAVPPPITGNFLTLRADISFAGLDEYVIRKKIIESKTTDLNTKTSETVGKTNKTNTQKPKTVYELVNRDKVIIEDWNSDDEDDVSEVTDHLIKDCDFYDKRSSEPKLKNVVNTGVLTRTGLITPVKQNEKRAVHKVSTARPVSTIRPISTVRSFAPKIAQTSGAIRPIYPRMDNVRPRGSYSPIKRSYYTKPTFKPKDLKQDVKTFGVQKMTIVRTRAVVNTDKGKMDTDLKKSRWVWRLKGHYLNRVSKDSGSFMLKKVEYVDPKGISKSDHAVVDSGCSSHITGNKAYLLDYEDYNGGFVAFGSDPKGDELKFNLFSVSQMCDKKNSVLFTETECLILSPSFKLLDESQVVLRAPRKDDVYILDLKNIIHSGANGLKNVLVPLDHFPINALTSKVLSFMVKKGKHFSGNVTPLFESMLVQPTEDEGEASERQSEPQPTPSPPHLCVDPYEIQPDPSPRPLPTIPIPDSIPEGSGGNHRSQSSSDRSLSADNKGWVLTIQSGYDLMSDLCLYDKQDKECIHEAKIGRKEIIKEKVDAKGVYYMELRHAQVRGRTSSVVLEREGKDDETIAEFLVSMSQNKAKQKGVEIKDAEDSDRPRATSTRSFDQLGKDEEIARKVQEDWEAEEEMKKLAEEEATKAALIQDFDDILARIEVDRLLAARLQEEERETFTVEERAKFLYDTIAAQRRFLAQQRAAAIRSRPPTRTQLRNQMMTYLKHVGGKKHADLKNTNFEEIQVLYKKVKRSNKDFIAIGFVEDERQIKEMNEESKDPKKKRVVNETPREEDTAKVLAEQEVTEQGTKKRKSCHVKMIARKRPRPKPDDDSDDEHRKFLRIVAFDSTLDSEIMETKSFVSKLHKFSSPDGDYLVVYRVNGHFKAFNYLMEVLHIFDRQDLFHLYDLVMKQYSKITPEGIELILWGDLKIMMESSTEENDQELEDGTVIYMLVERRYPLSNELLQRMLDLGLEKGIGCLANPSTTNGLQFTMSNRHQELTSPEANGFWLSIHLVVYNEELAIPEQTANGKGISNPLMAGSLPKTTKPT
ncbi:hypothetical protein Tco_0582667 [Tanacetum coccineum]